ncbi:uncharacterized protein [Primulina eburnea]|uniref:uncharacterized protein isoform X1 n=1 Tax=Primulina eburnea TaxID=1245227 RepID=UPI003C6C57E5
MLMLLVYVDFFAMHACIGYLMIFANVLVFIFEVNWEIMLLERFGAGLNEALPAKACIGYIMIFANVLVFIFEVNWEIMLLERFGAGLNEALPAKLNGKSCFLRGLALALMRRYLLRHASLFNDFNFEVNWEIMLLERFGAGLNELLPATACIGYLMIFANVLVFNFEVNWEIMLLEGFGAGLNEVLPVTLCIVI